MLAGHNFQKKDGRGRPREASRGSFTLRGFCVAGLILMMSLVAAAEIDLDNDGLGDIWEMVNGAEALQPGADADGDGRTNGDEARAGTDPFSTADLMAVREMTVEGAQIRLRWPCKPGKRYQVLRAATPHSSDWVPVSPLLAGTGDEVVVTTPFEQTAGFYRIAVFDTDTDSDGLTDSEELATGFDPANAHTLGAGSDDDRTTVMRALSSPNVVNVAPEDATASESGSDPGAWVITRTGNLNAITVHYTITGSATAGVDFAPLSGSVQFGFSVNRAVIPLSPLLDGEVESEESVVLTLAARPEYQVGAQTQAAVQIADAPAPVPGQRTYFVKPDGSDTAGGLTRTGAFRTIQRAADVVEAGDTVVVLPGTYSESVQLTRAGTADRPITFRADGIARGRVTVSGARRDIRDNTATWTLENDLGLSGVYSTPLDYTPIRVLAGDIDLWGYPSLDEFKRLWVNSVTKSGKPGPGPRQGWVMNGGKLYVRIHPNGQYGSVDPSRHVMKVGPRMAAGSFGHTVEKPSDYNFGVLTSGASHVVIEGFTFETPGMCGIYAPKSHVTARNCWAIGCRALVAGKAADDYDDTCSDTLVEYCEYTEQGTLQDIREVVDVAATLPPETYATLHSIYWWHRKGGPLTYEYGIVACAGTRWTVRNCFMHDTFDGLSWRSVSWSRNMEVSHNIFANIVDNAVELEDHSQGMRVHHNYIRDTWSPLSYQPNTLTNLPNDAEFHHNISYMSAQHSAFWRGLLGRQVASVFKLFTYGQTHTNLPGNGIRHHHNTFWHPSGSVINTANLGDFMSGFSFEDNIVVARTLDIRRPDPPIPNYQMARNFVAPAASTQRGPGARFAGPGGAVYSNWPEIGMRDPAAGDLSLLPGSPAATGDASGQAVGAIGAGETWTPPAAGPRVTPIAELGATGAAPVAVNDGGQVARGGWVKVYVLANDSDANRDLLTLLSAGHGNFGTTHIEGQQVIYTPGANFTATDQFNYTIGDGSGNTATATVTVSRINAKPVATADTVQAQPGAEVVVNVVANDTDADNDALFVQSFTQGTRGSVAMEGASIRYTPLDSNPGADSFTCTISDGQGATATAKVSVVALPNPPVALPENYTVQNSEQKILEVLANDHDGNGGSTALEFEDATHGAKGKVDFRGATATSLASIRYTPYANASGTDSFTYTVRNLSGQTATATVSLELVVNAKPALVRDYYYANQSVPIVLDVLVNDSDPDGDAMTITSLTTPVSGSVTIEDNKLRYVGSALGWDTFYYTVTDARGASATAQVSIYVKP